MRSTYGDLRPVRVVYSRGVVNRTLIYPHSGGDAEADAVRRSFSQTKEGFRTVLGTVSGTTYAGRTSAGGFGRTIDLHGDGKPAAHFSQPCGFVLQLAGGKVIAAEADRAVTAVIQGKTIALKPYSPVTL